MPGGFAISGGQANLNDQGANAAGSNGTTLTASGSTNTKGSYSQLVASTPYDCSGFYLYLCNANSGLVGYLVDIAIGAAASEQNVVNNLLYEFSTAQTHQTLQIFVPCEIPAGTRISGRCQASTGSSTITAFVVLADASFVGSAAFGAPTTYGAVTGTSQGTNVDPGASGNTKGSYSQVTASTTYDIAALQIIFGNKGALQTSDILVDIAVGAAGSEQVIIPNISFSASNASTNTTGVAPPLYFVRVPAGTRLAARAQNSNTTSGTRQFNIEILGYPQ